MTTIAIPIESHDVHSRRLIAHAKVELEKGDRLQASEKAWGAVAHRLKSISDRRGWEYVTHRQVYGIVDRLVVELGDPRLRDLFAYAHGLHRNYYVDAMPIEELRFQIGKAEEMLDILDLVE